MILLGVRMSDKINIRMKSFNWFLFFVSLFLFNFLNPNTYAQAQDNLESYRQCLGSEYGQFENYVNNYEALKNETFNSYQLEGWQPGEKFKSKAFENLCTANTGGTIVKVVYGISSFPAWLGPLCATYNFGQGYNKVANKVIMNGVKFMPDRGINNIYRTYLRDNKDLCENPTNLPRPTGYEYYLPAEAQKDKELIQLLMFRGWQKYCKKVNGTKEKIEEKKDLCVPVPNLINTSLLDAGVKLGLLSLRYSFEKPREYRGDTDKPNWEVYEQHPVAGTLMRRNINNTVSLKIRLPLTGLRIGPAPWLNSKPGENKQLQAIAYFRYGPSRDVTQLPETTWSSNNKIASASKGKVTISNNAKNGQEAIITATYSSHGLSKSTTSKVAVKTVLELKKIQLKPQNSTSLKTIDTRKVIKAFAVFSDNSQQEITNAKETKWNVESGKGMAFFPEKGELKIQAICDNSMTVTASYTYNGKTKTSKNLIYAIHPEFAFVPWVITRTKDLSVKMIKDNRLIPDAYDALVHDKSYAINDVTYQDPSQCQLVKKGTKVSIQINPDASEKFSKVPDVISLSLKEAAALIGKHRLSPLVTHSPTYTKEVTLIIGGKTVTRQIKPDHVLSQKPAAGKTVKQGSDVKITLNYGWATSMVKVPDLIGRTKDYAYTVLPKLRLGLQTSIAPSYDKNFNPGEIISQKPPKNSEVPVGTTVYVTINPSVPQLIKVPDLICMTESKARETLSKLQLVLQTNLASSYDSQCFENEVIEQNPLKGKQVTAGTVVKVLMNPGKKAIIGIKILPEKKRSYPLNTKLTFKEDVTRKNKNSTYTFKWYINGKSKSSKDFFTHTFTKAGSYYVMLDMVSSKISSENDTIRTTVNIGNSQDSQCSMTFDPSLNKDKPKYIQGDTVTFKQEGKNIQNVTKFNWYVNDRYVGSGKSWKHTFNTQGTSQIKLGLQKDSNFNEIKCTKSITIGSRGIGVLGAKRNRFKDKGAPEDLSICSEYWIGRDDWSPQCTTISSIGPVDGHALCTGDQSDGYNSGFLVYSDKGSEKLNFEIYHFNFNKRKGVLEYSGVIPEANNPDPNSIAVSCRENVVDVRWANEDGSECSTKIWKFKHSGVLAHSGLEKASCSKPIIQPKKLKQCKIYAKKAVSQFKENLKECNLQSDEWHGDEERHKQWCLNVSQKEANELTKHRDNSLKTCGKTWCDSYAKKAVEQNEDNLNKQCGFTGRSWQSTYRNHYNWCNSVSKKSSDSAIRERDNKLKKCQSVRQGPCQKYAEKAVKQNAQNLQKDCGFCGQRWQSSFDNHVQWCLEQPLGIVASETKAREKLLRSCKDVSSNGKRTFFEPCYNDYRLDNCLNFSTNCEKPAADKFCEEKGFTQAISWNLEKARPTYIIGDSSLCDEEACAGFEHLTCSGYLHPANKKPTCNIKRPNSGVIIQPGKYMSFSADAYDPDRDKLSYTWNFEGAKPAKKENSWHGSATGIKYNTPGSYTTTLTVTDNKGGTCTDIVSIIVQDKVDAFDCDQYADKSVQQNQRNIDKKCGFTNEIWHSNKSGHTNWCQNAGPDSAAQSIVIREKALSECNGAIPTTDFICEITAPAKIAFPDAGKTINFAGKAQSPSGTKFSYNWKFGEYGADPGTSLKQKPGSVKFQYSGSYTTTMTVTDSSGKTCQDTRYVLVYDNNEPREFCEGYAEISIKQSQDNLQNKCGYSGEQWHGDEYRHSKWCSSASKDQIKNELTDRDEKLRKCTKKNFTNSQTPQKTGNGSAGTGAIKQNVISLTGNWVGDGHNVSISQNAQNIKATAAENRGPVGWKIAIGKVKGNTVYMNFNGQNLTGKIVSQKSKILWSNNATWTRVIPGSSSLGQSNESNDLLGTRWDESELGWSGMWSRRGKSNVFDARWTLGSRQENAVLTITIQGNTVHVKRQQSPGSSFVGQECDYNGILGADNITVTGTYSCNWASGPFNWRATIQNNNTSPSSGGDVINENLNNINVISATYGSNCGVADGNVTDHIAKQCNGKPECQYTVDHNIIGDPAYGCAKTYTVRYRCRNNPQVYERSLDAEAGLGNKTVMLECSASKLKPSAMVTGQWIINQSNGYKGKLQLQQDPSGHISGTADWGNLQGTLKGIASGNEIKFTINYPGGIQGHYTGSVTEGSTKIINGTSKSSTGDSAQWDALLNTNPSPTASGENLEPIADSHVYAYSYAGWSKANWGKYEILGAGWHPSGGEKRAFLKFDLSGIDPNSVGKATLKLFHYHTGGGNSVDLGVYLVTSHWTEGRGTYKPATKALSDEISWVNQPSIDRYPVVYFNPGKNTNKWLEVDITPLVKAWLSGIPNHGMAIKGGEELKGKPQAQYGFYSRESKDSAKRPILQLSD